MFKRFLSIMMAVIMTSQASFAAVITTGTAINLEQRGASIAQVEALLARHDVREAMVMLGVTPEHAAMRVQSLTDAELADLQARLESLPAGAGVLEIVGIVAVVLIVLELVGVIDIFKKA